MSVFLSELITLITLGCEWPVCALKEDQKSSEGGTLSPVQGRVGRYFEAGVPSQASLEPCRFSPIWSPSSRPACADC